MEEKLSDLGSESGSRLTEFVRLEVEVGAAAVTPADDVVVVDGVGLGEGDVASAPRHVVGRTWQDKKKISRSKSALPNYTCAHWARTTRALWYFVIK